MFHLHSGLEGGINNLSMNIFYLSLQNADFWASWAQLSALTSSANMTKYFERKRNPKTLTINYPDLERTERNPNHLWGLKRRRFFCAFRSRFPIKLVKKFCHLSSMHHVVTIIHVQQSKYRTCSALLMQLLTSWWNTANKLRVLMLTHIVDTFCMPFCTSITHKIINSTGNSGTSHSMHLLFNC